MAINIKEIKLEDKCRDFNWILKQYKENKLLILGKPFTDTSFESFRLFIKHTEEIYEDSWDIDIKATAIEGEYKIDIQGVVIHFPEITIKNSSKKEHVITDLIVKVVLYIGGTRLMIHHLEGGRLSISYAEFSSNYFHSHLPGYYNRNGNQSPFYSNFCKGSGHINQFIAELNSEVFNQGNIEPFLIQISGLVIWESLEGGPHRKIRYISIRTITGRKFTISDVAVKAIKHKILEKHREGKIKPVLDFKIENNTYTIVDNENIDVFIVDTVELSSQDLTCILVMEDSTGTYYKYGQAPGYLEVPNTEEEVYIFKGQEIAFRIGEAPTTGDTSSINYFVHPEVRQIIKKEIEYDINISQIRESTIQRYRSEINDATEGIEPDKVVM